jgi:hypothetical protein
MHRPKDRKRNDDPEGHYSNYFKVGFNSFEFILDFGQAYEGVAAEVLHTRIVTGPAYAKALSRLLTDSLAAYERTCGAIPEIDNQRGGP